MFWIGAVRFMKVYSLCVVTSILDGLATSVFCPSLLCNVTHLSNNMDVLIWKGTLWIFCWEDFGCDL